MSERWIPKAVESLREFVDAGVLGATEVQVVATLAAAAAAEGRPCGTDEILAAALAVRAPLHGHVRVDLTTVARTVVAEQPGLGVLGERSGQGEGTDDDPFTDPLSDLPADLDGVHAPTRPPETAPDAQALAWPDPSRWAERLTAGVLARSESTPPGQRVEPLVLSGDHLYLERLWRDEVAIAEDLRSRAAEALETDAHTRAAVERLFPPDREPTPGAAATDPPPPGQLFDPDHPPGSRSPVGAGNGSGSGGDDGQRRAGLCALENRLVVIAGGPGTGKTRTVAHLLAALQLGAVAAGEPPLEVALAAPTGKAAARMTEAVRKALTELDLPPRVSDLLTSCEALTLHRLLGARDGGARFRHDARNPLSADVVVVDEVSMVSLPLMARLLEAVPARTRLVLVGDPHQLASVEAGAVLGDLVGTQGRSSPPCLSSNVVVLDRVYRYGPGSAIAALAAAVNSGDAEAVVDLLRSGGPNTDGTVAWVDPTDEPARDRLEQAVLGHASDLVDTARRGDVADALRSLGHVKVLAATRRGPLGVEAWNRTVETRLRGTGRMRRRWSAGRPVMVTANDYLNGVFNGDVGVVLRAGGPGAVKVAFGEPDLPRLLDPTQLDRLEDQWAMTIHKSQGSEFDRVVVALPEPPSPVLTRELLYTAVTRAREQVTLLASEDSVRAAVDQPVRRASGLAERLA